MKSKWGLLYVILAVLILFSVFAAPRIAIRAMNSTKGQIISVQEK